MKWPPGGRPHHEIRASYQIYGALLLSKTRQPGSPDSWGISQTQKIGTETNKQMKSNLEEKVYRGIKRCLNICFINIFWDRREHMSKSIPGKYKNIFYPMSWKLMSIQKNLHIHVFDSFIHNCQNWKQTRCSSKGEQINCGISLQWTNIHW